MAAPFAEFARRYGARVRRDEGATPAGPGVAPTPTDSVASHLVKRRAAEDAPHVGITVFLADDNVIVREGVRALLGMEPDLEIVGTRGRLRRARRRRDASSPRRCSSPTSACRRPSSRKGSTRRRRSAAGTRERASSSSPSTTTRSTRSRCCRTAPRGTRTCLKDRVAEGDQLARSVREVAVGRIGARSEDRRGDRLARHPRRRARPPTRTGCSQHVAEGRPIKAIAAMRADHAGGDRPGRRGALRHPVGGGQDRGIQRAAPAPPPPPGDRRPGGAGRDPEPPPPDRRRREGPRQRRAHRRDRGADGHRAHVGRPRLLRDRRAVRSERARRASSTSIGPR